MALRIDASGDRLVRTTNLPRGANGNFTITGWFQPVADNSEGKQTVFFLGENVGNFELDYVGINYSVNTIGRRTTYEAGEGGIDAILLAGWPSTGVWHWFGYGFSGNNYSMGCAQVGNSVSWQEGTTPYAITSTATHFSIGKFDTAWSWFNARFLAFKVWDTKLTTAQMEAERYYYPPQLQTNVHAWYPLITESSDHGDNDYNWTEEGTLTWEDYTPAGMNPMTARNPVPMGFILE